MGVNLMVFNKKDNKADKCTHEWVASQIVNGRYTKTIFTCTKCGKTRHS